MHMLVMALGLVAAAWMAAGATEAGQRPAAWLFLGLLLLPIALQFGAGELRNPWRAFEMALYVSSAWLVYRMAGAEAAPLLGSREWCLLLGVIGNVSVLFAVLQQFRLPIFSGLEIFPIWQEYPVAFAGMLVQQNLQGLFLALVCMPLWARGLSEPSAYPWWLASLLPCAGVWATSSRGSVLVLLVGAAMLVWLSRKRVASLIRLFAVIGLAAGVSAYWQMFPEITGQSVTLVDRMASVGIQARFFIWEMCLRLFMEHPWLGIGAGNLVSYGTEATLPVLAAHPEFAAASTALSGGHASAHNLLLQFLMEWGVLGGMAVFALFGTVVMRVWRILASSGMRLCDSSVQAGIGLFLMFMHGMFSVSMGFGFCMILFALYAAALFSEGENSCSDVQSIHGGRLFLMLIPALFMFYNWQIFVTRQWQAEEAARLSIHDPEFASRVGAAVDNPWSSRAALEWYFSRLTVEHVRASRLVASENLAYRFWMLHQSSVSLRYLILIAHLKDDIYAERRRVTLFLAAYPGHEMSEPLRLHMEDGHAQGEPINLAL